MKTWVLNRRGYTFCASAALLLFIFAFTTLFYYPDVDPIPSTSDSRFYYSDKEPWEESPIVSSPSAPESTPPSWNGGVNSPPTRPPVGGWTFDPVLDERNFGLSEEQCSVAFPGFYAEVDRAIKYRKDKGLHNITSELVDIAWRPDEIMRAMIYNKQVREKYG
jgi:hypothetical protein